MPTSALQSTFQSLQSAHEAGQDDLVSKALSTIKLQLAKAGLLFPSPSADHADLLIARSTLEIGAFHSLRIKDIKAFERYMSQLGVFYRDLASTLPPSASRPPLTGLHLLSLLSSGRIADFHTTLEALAGEQDGDEQGGLLKDEFVMWPVDLERWLMEGSYTKVWRARERVPRPEYGVLLDGLVGTIRNEIAQCHEKAYGNLPLEDATRLLFFRTGSETTAFGEKRGWSFSPISKTFTFPSSLHITPNGPEDVTGRERIIKTALHYANELEAIV